MRLRRGEAWTDTGQLAARSHNIEGSSVGVIAARLINVDRIMAGHGKQKAVMGEGLYGWDLDVCRMMLESRH